MPRVTPAGTGGHVAPAGETGHLLILWHSWLHGFIDVPVRNKVFGASKADVQRNIVRPTRAVGCHGHLLLPSVGWREMARGRKQLGFPKARPPGFLEMQGWRC